MRFEAAVIEAYYGRLMQQADQDKRISNVPYEPTVPVYTAWDLGVRDLTAIWFAQVVGREIRLIDYYEANGVDLGHYVRNHEQPLSLRRSHRAARRRPRELGTGKSRLEVLESLGLKSLTIAPMHRVEDGINGARTIIRAAGSTRRNAPRYRCAETLSLLNLTRSDDAQAAPVA